MPYKEISGTLSRTMAPFRATRVGTANGNSPFAQLLAAHPEALATVSAGEVVHGRVLERAPSSLYVDLGASGVGIVYGRELLEAPETFRTVARGDELEAVVIEPENEQGYVELSLRSASEEKSWAALETKQLSADIFPTQILDANKGGLIVRIESVTGFLPVSQLSAEHYPRVEGGDKLQILDRLRQYTGQMFNVRVITADRREGKLIVSEKAAMSADMEAALSALRPGTVIEGMVSGIVDFGVFVKFPWNGQDLEGLIHISELAWQRVDDPKEYAKIGQTVKAMVLGTEGTRISLSFKQLRPDPWRTVEEKYHLGDTVEGDVIKLTPYGAFVKLDDDIHGLAHVSELSDKEGMRPEDVVKVGARSTFRIINIDPDEHRLGLSLRPDSKPKEKKTRKAAEPKSKKSATSAKKTGEERGTDA